MGRAFILFTLLFSGVVSAEKKPKAIYKVGPNEVTEMVIKNNTKIALAILDRKIAAIELTAAPVDYDYFLTVTPLEYKLDRKLSAYTYEDALTEETTVATSVGLKKKFMFGTTFETSLQLLRFITTASTDGLPSRYQGAWLFKATHPLLKEAGDDHNQALIRKSQFKRDRYIWKLRETLDEQLVKALSEFWELVKTRKEIKIKKQSLELAKETYDFDRRLFKAGKKSKVDLQLSEAQLETSRAKLKIAESKYYDVEEKLAKEILPHTAAASDFDILPIEEKKLDFSGKKEINAIQKSIETFRSPTNAKLSRMESEIQEAQTDVDKAEDAKLPQLDASFEYLSSGLNTDFGNTFTDLTSQSFPSWEFKFSFSFPIGNHSAEGDFQRLRAIRDRKTAEKGKEGVEQRKNIYKISNNIEKHWKKLGSIRARVKQGKKKLETKRKLYRVGRIARREYREAINEHEELQLQETTERTSLEKEILRYKQIANRLDSSPKTRFLKSQSI